MPGTPFPFKNAAGQLDLPTGPVRAHALFAHCFTCTRKSLAATRISQALALEGIAVLRFDFTGLGDSEGTFAADGFSGDIADLVAAAKAMADAGRPVHLLVGHSLGGAAVLAAAEHLPEVAAVATIAAPYDVSHIRTQFGDGLRTIMEKGTAEVTLAGRPFTVSRSFLEDLDTHDQHARIAALHRPLLLLHAPLDATVGIDNAGMIFAAAKHPKSFVSLDKADHLLTKRPDADYAAGVIAAWAARYLDLAAEPEAAPPPVGVAVAEPTSVGVLQHMILAGGARFLADEPVSAGGLGSGPSPFELLASALAGCTAMTLKLYADRKGWPAPVTRVEVAHAKVDGIDVFTCTIRLAPGFEEDRRAKLLEIAGRCPVHLALERGARIDTHAPAA